MKTVLVLLGLGGLAVAWQWIRARSKQPAVMSDTDWWLYRVYRDQPDDER